MSLALVRQINKSYVSPSFLLQSWLATVSLFSGLYVLIYLLVPDYTAFVLFPTDQPGPYAVIDVVAQFFWFSLCTMTTTGCQWRGERVDGQRLRCTSIRR
jgi:hypothetical protein